MPRGTDVAVSFFTDPSGTKSDRLELLQPSLKHEATSTPLPREIYHVISRQDREKHVHARETIQMEVATLSSPRYFLKMDSKKWSK